MSYRQLLFVSILSLAAAGACRCAEGPCADPARQDRLQALIAQLDLAASHGRLSAQLQRVESDEARAQRHGRIAQLLGDLRRSLQGRIARLSRPRSATVSAEPARKSRKARRAWPPAVSPVPAQASSPALPQAPQPEPPSAPWQGPPPAGSYLDAISSPPPSSPEVFGSYGDSKSMFEALQGSAASSYFSTGSDSPIPTTGGEGRSSPAP